MDPTHAILLDVVFGLLITFGWLSIAIIIWWLIATQFFFTLRTKDGRSHSYALAQDVKNVWLQAIAVIATGVSVIISATASIAGTVVANAQLFITIAVLGTVSIGFMGTQPEVIGFYLTARQCVIVPALETLVYPFLNVIRMTYDMAVGGAYWWGRVQRFIFTGWQRVLTLCAGEAALGEVFRRITLFLRAFSIEMNLFLVGNPTIARFTIKQTLFRYGELAESTLEIWDCFCSFLFFLVEDVVKIFQSIEFQCGLDHVLNTVVRIVQIPFASLFMLKLPTIIPVIEEFCPAVTLTGDTIELALKLVLNSFFGLLTIHDELPPEVNEVLDVPWSHIIMEPVCGIGILANMTLEASLHLVQSDGVFAADGSGIRYFRFRQVIDRLLIAVNSLAGLFVFISPRIPLLLNGILEGIVNGVYFLLEFAPGIFFAGFFPFGGDFIDKILSFMVEFWDRPFDINPIFRANASYIDALAALGDLVSDINVPLGEVLEHVMRLGLAVGMAVLNFAYYSWDIIQFVGPPTHKVLNDVDMDPVFVELIAICESVADLFRQFDGVEGGFAWCEGPGSEGRFWCCVGNLLESLCRLITVLFREIVLFMQSLVSWMASNTIPFHDLTFDEALQEAKFALCAFSCMITGLIPTSIVLTCEFTDPGSGPTCNDARACLAGMMCSSLKLILIPIEIANDLFNKIKGGGSFASMVDFFASVVTRTVIQLATLFADVGGLLDCLICTISGHTGCSHPIYTILKALGDAIVTLVGIFTDVFFGIINLFITFFTTLFVDGNLIKAFGDLILGVITLFSSTIGDAIIDGIRQLGLEGLADFLDGIINGIGTAVDCIGDFFGCIGEFFSTGGCAPICTKKRTAAEDGVLTTEHNGGAITVNEVLERHNARGQWPAENACAGRMEGLGRLAYHDLSHLHKAEVAYCIAHVKYLDDRSTLHERHWAVRHQCDTLLEHYIGEGTNWATLRYSEQIEIGECLRAVEFMNWVKDATDIPWLPNDMFANPYRMYVYGAELFGDARISWQYHSDRSQTPAVVRSAAYQEQWRQRGMWTGHYDQMYTDGDVNSILASTPYETYFRENRGRHLEASRAIISGLGVLLDSVGVSLERASTYYDPENDIAIPLTSGPIYRSQFIVSKSHALLHDFYSVVGRSYNGTLRTPEKRRAAFQAAIGLGYDTANVLGIAFKRLRGVASDYLSAWSADRRMMIRVLEGQATAEETAAYEAAHARDVGWNEWLFTQFKVYPRPGTPEEQRILRERPTLTTEWNHAVATFWKLYEGTPASRLRTNRVAFMYHAVLDIGSMHFYNTELTPLENRVRRETDLTNYRTYKVRGRDDGVLYTRSQLPADQMHRFEALENWGGSIFALPCASGVQWLCDNCFYIDQIVGWIILTTAKAILYYTGPRYLDKSAIANELFVYLADSSAPARLGNTAALPLRFPNLETNSLDYIGINGTLTRFSDIFGAASESAPSRRGTVASSPSPGSMNEFFITIMQPIIEPLFFFVDDALAILTNPAETSGENNLFVALFEKFITCDYQEELFGTNKPFSPGEILLVYALISGATGFSVVVTSPIDMMYYLFVVQSFLTLVFGSMYMTLTQSYSYMCLTTMPFDMWTDLMHTMVYELYARCSFMLAALVKDEDYDLTTCSSCSKNRVIQIHSCQNEVGFVDLLSNIAFSVVRDAPDIAPTLEMLPLIGERITFYRDSIDYTDPHEYSLVYTCAYTISLLPNMAVAVMYGTLAGALTPALLAAILLLGAIVAFVIAFFFMILTMLRGLYTSERLMRFSEYRSLRQHGTFGIGLGGGGGGGGGGLGLLYRNRHTGELVTRPH